MDPLYHYRVPVSIVKLPENEGGGTLDDAFELHICDVPSDVEAMAKAEGAIAAICNVAYPNQLVGQYKIGQAVAVKEASS